MLTVTVKRATNLKGVDSFGKLDPYVKVTAKGQHKETKTIRANRSPEWNETFSFLGSLGDFILHPLGVSEQPHRLLLTHSPPTPSHAPFTTSLTHPPPPPSHALSTASHAPSTASHATPLRHGRLPLP